MQVNDEMGYRMEMEPISQLLVTNMLVNIERVNVMVKVLSAFPMVRYILVNGRRGKCEDKVQYLFKWSNPCRSIQKQ